MTEEEFRRQFDRNRRAGRPTFVVDGAGNAGIALELNGPSKIVLHEGKRPAWKRRALASLHRKSDQLLGSANRP